MSGPGSVTVWLDRRKAGGRDEAGGRRCVTFGGGGRRPGAGEEAVARLWERSFGQRVARARPPPGGRRAVADGGDVALSAFDGLAGGVAAGGSPRLNDRDDLWQVLL